MPVVPSADPSCGSIAIRIALSTGSTRNGSAISPRKTHCTCTSPCRTTTHWIKRCGSDTSACTPACFTTATSRACGAWRKVWCIQTGQTDTCCTGISGCPRTWSGTSPSTTAPSTRFQPGYGRSAHGTPSGWRSTTITAKSSEPCGRMRSTTPPWSSWQATDRSSM